MYRGNGVQKAVDNVNNVLGPAIIARKFDLGNGLADIDALMLELDGTADKSKLGANAILGISMACARAAASEQVCSRPVLLLCFEKPCADCWTGSPVV